MDEGLLSTLRMWPFQSGKSEAFVNAFLSYLGTYPPLENVAPLGGKDGGRDLQSADGQFRVACYFPIKEHKPYTEIKNKFISDMNKAKEGGAENFIFVTGQALQLAEKKELEKLSLIPKTTVYCCYDIITHISRPDAGFLRAELGFASKTPSYDETFSRDLYSAIGFKSLILLINESIPPKIFPYRFIHIFDGVSQLYITAQPRLLSEKLREPYDRWRKSVAKFEEILLHSDKYDYKADQFVMRQLKADEYRDFYQAASEAFSEFTERTLDLARAIEDQCHLPLS